MGKLADKVAIITSGNSGIGLASAWFFDAVMNINFKGAFFTIQKAR